MADGPLPQHSIIDGQRVALTETVRHARDRHTICLFRLPNGEKRYVSAQDWLEGCEGIGPSAGGTFPHVPPPSPKDETVPNGTAAPGAPPAMPAPASGPSAPAPNRPVTASSSREEKLALFRSLFRGRDDVYAHGYPKADGGIGYVPACMNEWKRGTCPKTDNRFAKCSECGNRRLKPLDDGVLLAHFKGESPKFHDVVGLYVMDRDCRVRVLVADFDGPGWEREVIAYKRAAAASGVSACIERSRSGAGAHAWVFFSEAVPAAVARKLGSCFITQAMESGQICGFGAYDRLFPTQDTIAAGGFGNLIALPFQGRARQRGNTLFVDERLEPFPDQWRFMSSISKVPPEQAGEIVGNSVSGPLGRLAYERPRGAGEGSGGAEAPSGETAMPCSGACRPRGTEAMETGSSAADGTALPACIRITKAAGLRIARAELTPSLENGIRRLAAFGNPEFYRAQSMRQSVYGKPRIIDLSEADDDELVIPRGCESRLASFLRERGMRYEFEDRRQEGRKIDVSFSGELRESQKEAADALLRSGGGILSAPTGFGKTVIAAFLVGAIKRSTLVIVPGKPLLEQWMDSLAGFLDIDEELPALLTPTGRKSRKKRSPIGQIGAGKNNPSGIVDVATYQSLLEKGEIEGTRQVKRLVEEYGVVICDECHHGGSSNLARILSDVPAVHVFGLSATPKRSDGLEKIVFMHCGRIVYKVDPKRQAADQGFARLLQPRFTHIRIPGIEPGTSFNQILDKLCTHAPRNKLIVDDAADCMMRGRRPLILTKRREHAQLLADDLEKRGCTVFLLIGSGGAREKSERMRSLFSAPEDEAYCIVATGSYIGEGFDDPRLDTLILADPVSWEGIVTQYSGRLHRERPGKEDVIVYDYVDAGIPMLDRMYEKRLKTYGKLGYRVAATEDEGDAPRAGIFGCSDYAARWYADIDGADQSIIVFAPYADARCLERLSTRLEPAVLRGIDVSIGLRKPADGSSLERERESAALLDGIGCKVEWRDECPSAMAVIDEELVWYGSIPLLAFPRKDDCSLRFRSPEVAGDLLGH